MSTSDDGKLAEQYHSLRAGEGFVELANWSAIRVTGRDRQAFLHNFSTNDIKRLRTGQNCEAFFTNVKGKIVGHGIVDCRADELVILGSPGQAARLVEHLDRYVIREDVHLHDITEERSCVLLHRKHADGGEPLIGWNIVGDDAYGIIELPRTKMTDVRNRLADRGIVRLEYETFTAARIEAGFPLFGLDFNDSNFPQEIGRDRQAISFTKGCYLGQETVARIDALGHVNQQLAGVRFLEPSVPDAGLELSRAGNIVGRVSSAGYSPKLDAPLAFAMLRREANAVGTRLESPVGACEVIALPV
jgi:folate-binding protein YgfZ